MKKILIRFNLSSLGDTLAWIPYTEKYRVENNLEKIYVKCNDLWVDTFFKRVYPNHVFNPDEDIHSFDRIYNLSWTVDASISNVTYPSFNPLQKIASSQLGFSMFEEIRPRIYVDINLFTPPSDKIVSIGTYSTAQAKFWNNPTGWDEVVNYLNDRGYSVYCLDRYNSFGKPPYMNTIPNNVIFEKNINIAKIVSIISQSKFFIGLSSGLSWLSWAIGIPVVMVSGFSDPISEFTEKMYRVHTKKGCNSCYNRSRFNPSDWLWCPDQDNKEEIFECSKLITGEDVIEKINLLI